MNAVATDVNGFCVMAKSSNKYNVTAEQFVEVWETSATLQEAAQRLNMPPEITAARASDYRSRGIRLKLMPRAKSVIDVEKLNRKIEAMGRQMAEGKISKMDEELVEAITDKVAKANKKK